MSNDINQDSNGDALPAAQLTSPANALAQGNGANLIKGLAVDGTFTMTQVANLASLNFLANARGELQNLVIRLKETPRGTANFFQLSQAATLEITCDLRKIIHFTPESSVDAEDDAYKLLLSRLQFGAAGNNVAEEKWKLDMKPALAGDASLMNNAVYVANDQQSQFFVKSRMFPVGGIVTSIAGLPDAENGVTVELKTSADPPATATFLAVENQQFGMTLYGHLVIDVGASHPTVTLNTTFEPDVVEGQTALGAVGRGDGSVTINVLGADNFNTSQLLTVGNTNDDLAAGQLDHPQASGVNGAAPGASDADNFSLTLTVAALAGALGDNMQQEVKKDLSAAKLIESFQVDIEGINQSPTSDFSKFLRNLVKERDGDEATEDQYKSPLKDGDTIIVRDPAAVSIEVKPFQYAFTPAGQGDTNAQVQSFNVLHNVQVYAVLKQKKDSDTPILSSADQGVSYAPATLS